MIILVIFNCVWGNVNLDELENVICYNFCSYCKFIEFVDVGKVEFIWGYGDGYLLFNCID